MRIAICLAVFAALLTTAGADDFESLRQANWHQWRGPNADGVSPNGTPPTQWDESTNVKWKVPIPGAGSSTPIIWQDRIYLTTAVPTEKKGNSAAQSSETQGRAGGVVGVASAPP